MKKNNCPNVYNFTVRNKKLSRSSYSKISYHILNERELTDNKNYTTTEMREKKSPGRKRNQLLCKFCLFTSSARGLLKHLRKAHGVLSIEEGEKVSERIRFDRDLLRYWKIVSTKRLNKTFIDSISNDDEIFTLINRARQLNISLIEILEHYCDPRFAFFY